MDAPTFQRTRPLIEQSRQLITEGRQLRELSAARLEDSEGLLRLSRRMTSRRRVSQAGPL